MAISAAAAYVTLIDGIGQSSVGDDDLGRIQVRDAADRLLSRMYTPFERANVFAFQFPIIYAAMQTFMDLDLWTNWNKAGGGERTLDELVALCNHPDVAPNLLRRLLRMLVMVNMVQEKGVDRFAPTNFSRELGDPSTFVPHTIQCGTHHYLDPGRNLPAFLAKTGYKEPLDPKACNYVDAHPEKLEFFPRCQTDPALYASFIGHIEGYTRRKTGWTELIDTQRLLLDGADFSSDRPLVVDVGGNVGIDISRVLAKHPDLPAGALVLEDLPEVLAKADVDPRITKVEHDFFKPQPVKGSRAYYFHAVFHDWPDADSLKFLAHTAAAMEKGYSKVLIYEVVIPASGATQAQSFMDVGMMSVLSAFERTEANWHSLLGQAGLVIKNIWRDPKGVEALIEAELA